MINDGVRRISQERMRQVNSESWDAEHDSEYDDDELARAAVCYATPANRRATLDGHIPDIWPWDKKWWKPTPNDRIRELVKAGALIAAEIDRLLRLQEDQQGEK